MYSSVLGESSSDFFVTCWLLLWLLSQGFLYSRTGTGQPQVSQLVTCFQLSIFTVYEQSRRGCKIKTIAIILVAKVIGTIKHHKTIIINLNKFFTMVVYYQLGKEQRAIKAEVQSFYGISLDVSNHIWQIMNKKRAKIKQTRMLNLC